MIKIICVGKIKESYFREAIKEYQKRILKYTKLNVIEVPDFNSNNVLLELQKEKDKILENINSKEYVIALSIASNSLSSIEFSNKIDTLFFNYSTITFVIGGSSGLHDDVLKRANEQLSFSVMTFPHQLFRVILLEQIYRSFKIIKNESYHK